MVKLSNGLEVPEICFGTGIVLRYYYTNKRKWGDRVKYWIHNYFHNKKQYQLDKNLKQNLYTAMDCGINMFDTSSAYAGSECLMGKYLKKCDRKNYYILTKCDNYSQYQNDVRGALMRSLKTLKTDYVDLYLLHWPVTGKFLESWKVMEQLYKEGYCKAIGVCNCNVHHLKELEEVAEIMPMVNEIECHPLFTQEEVRAYCNEKNIKVFAYTSTARMDERLFKTPLVPIAKKYRKSVAQVILKWHIQRGNVPIVNSSKKRHLLDNGKVWDFTLTEDELQQIDKININSRLRYDPDNCDFHQL